MATIVRGQGVSVAGVTAQATARAGVTGEAVVRTPGAAGEGSRVAGVIKESVIG